MESSLPAWRTWLHLLLGEFVFWRYAFVACCLLAESEVQSLLSLLSCLICFVYLSPFCLFQVQNLPDLHGALQWIKDLLHRWAFSGIPAFHLIGCLSFCMLRVAVKLITHCTCSYVWYDFNALGPFRFYLQYAWFAWFFWKGQFLFLNGGDPGIMHAWPDACIRLRFNAAGKVPLLDLFSFQEFQF